MTPVRREDVVPVVLARGGRPLVRPAALARHATDAGQGPRVLRSPNRRQ